jgi:hypothetical protein
MDRRQRPRFDPFYQEQLRLIMAAWHEVRGKPDVAELWRVAVETATTMWTFPPSDDEEAPRNMYAGLLHRATQLLVTVVETESPALFHVYQQDLWRFIATKLLIAAGHPEEAKLICPQRFYHWFPDNPISHTPDGNDIVPPEATPEHINQLKADRLALAAHATRGRPPGAGRYFSTPQEFVQALLLTMRLIHHRQLPISQAEVARCFPFVRGGLEISPRQLRRWLVQFDVNFDELRSTVES